MSTALQPPGAATAFGVQTMLVKRPSYGVAS